MNDSPPRLTVTQQMSVDAARELLIADEQGTAALAANVGAPDQANPWPETAGAAMATIRHLLEVIDQLTGGQS